MQIKYSKIAAREIKQATVEIYGEIGVKVDGDYLAKEINWLAKEVDEITLRINSMGGSYVQGLSLISAITGSKARTVAVIEGIAASMAAFIALSCTQVQMNDFARIMVHAPYYRDDDGNRLEGLSKEDLAAIDQLKSQVAELLSRRGKSKEETTSILATDTWYTAEEALSEGFVDKIIDTGVAREAATLDLDRLAAFAQSFLPNTNIEMKKIAAKLGLPDTADEQAIIAAIDQKEAALSDSRKKLVDAAIAAGKKAGIVTDKNEVSMRKLAEMDMELFANLVITAKPAEESTRISEVIAKLTKQLEGKSGESEKDWDWYQKNDPVALQQMKTAEPAKYDALYKAYWES